MENLIKSHVSSLSCLQHHFILSFLLYWLHCHNYSTLRDIYIRTYIYMTNNCMSKSIHPRNVYLGDRHTHTHRVYAWRDICCRVWGAHKMFVLFSICTHTHTFRYFGMVLKTVVVVRICIWIECSTGVENEKEIAHSFWISSSLCVFVCRGWKDLKNTNTKKKTSE